MTETYTYESIRLSIDLVRHLIGHVYQESDNEMRVTLTWIMKLLSSLEQGIHEEDPRSDSPAAGVCSDCFWEAFDGTG